MKIIIAITAIICNYNFECINAKTKCIEDFYSKNIKSVYQHEELLVESFKVCYKK